MLVSSLRQCSLAALLGLLVLTAPKVLDAQSAPAAPPASPALQGAAFGQSVVLTWSAVPGATNYIAAVGVQSNNYLLVQSVGNVTTLSVAAPAGIYYVRVAAQNADGTGQPSNEVVVVVTPSTGTPPAPPSNLTGQVIGESALLSWQLGQGGGPTSGLVFAIGSTPGGQDLGFIPLRVSTSTVAPVPPGTYHTRLYAVGPGGISSPSNELSLTVGPVGCVTPVGPTLAANVNQASVNLSWNAIEGATNYRVDVSQTPGGPLVLAQMVGATTTMTATGVRGGDYYAKVTAINSCGAQATGNEVHIHVDAPINRTPDPAPGQRLPLPYRLSVLEEVARQYPGDLQNSCVEHGGNNTFLFRVVQRLRQEDTRWGLNWKRANRGDMSQDVINYHWGAGPDEDSMDTYVIDIISGHCGSGADVWWNNVTGVGGAGARWTLQPYTRAGFTP